MDICVALNLMSHKGELKRNSMQRNSNEISRQLISIGRSSGWMPRFLFAPHLPDSRSLRTVFVISYMDGATQHMCLVAAAVYSVLVIRMFVVRLSRIGKGSPC